MTKVELYAISTSTTLESNKSLMRLVEQRHVVHHQGSTVGVILTL